MPELKFAEIRKNVAKTYGSIAKNGGSYYSSNNG